jgi:hypothetical protein
MPDRLSLHAPLLVNTIGHCAGALAFGILFWLLLLDWRRATAEPSLLPAIAAGLALLWNVGSLSLRGESRVYLRHVSRPSILTATLGPG